MDRATMDPARRIFRKIARKIARVVPLFLILAFGLLTLVGHGTGGGKKRRVGPWTWMAGSSTGNLEGSYGTQGMGDPTNLPGSRTGAALWVANYGDMYLFGGLVFDPLGDELRSDLWRYDGRDWIWISGSDTAGQPGVYGSIGVPDVLNVPGARQDCGYWTDNAGNFWLFGGEGLDASGTQGFLNDLWRYDGTNWTWMAGRNVANPPADYGTMGVASPTNLPPGRARSAIWIRGGDQVWVFGGQEAAGFLNDLWRYDGTNWAWMGGSSIPAQPGVYGTRRRADAANVPGARHGAVSWRDDGGRFWLFGGEGIDAAGASGLLNDLWRFDLDDWTWMSGDTGTDSTGIYGTQRVASVDNAPGSRVGAASWLGRRDRLYLSGGFGLDSTGAQAYLPDVWSFKKGKWTWEAGSPVAPIPGDYGARTVASISNAPGGRAFAARGAVRRSEFWLFGGLGYDSTSGPLLLNDVWLYVP